MSTVAVPIVQATFVLGTFVHISKISISKLNTFDFSLVLIKNEIIENWLFFVSLFLFSIILKIPCHSSGNIAKGIISSIYKSCIIMVNKYVENTPNMVFGILTLNWLDESSPCSRK